MHGHVLSDDGKPIFMIKVCAYRESREVGKAYTDEQGRYNLDIEGGMPATLLFDTHHTLNNARDWHPSLAANIDPAPDLTLNRVVTDSGHGMDDAAWIDAFSAYMFASTLSEARDPGYASNAAGRLGQAKINNDVFWAMHALLWEHFQALAAA